MNKERDQFLTEAMGECYHDWENAEEKLSLYGNENINNWIMTCPKCGEEHYYNDAHWSEPEQNCFSTWEGFGKLWEWVKTQLWLDDWQDISNMESYNNVEVCLWIWSEYSYTIDPTYINPDKFADAVYDFLRGNK